jgi:hypothetical protein
MEVPVPNDQNASQPDQSHATGTRRKFLRRVGIGGGVAATLLGLTEVTEPPSAAAATQGMLQPSGDTSGATDTANITAALADGLASLSPSGTWYISNLTLGSNQTLEGNGAVLSVVAGTSGAVVSLASASSTREVAIRDVVIDCNSISGVTGVSLVNTGLPSSAPGNHRIWNVVVNNPGLDGIYLDDVIETYTGFTAVFNSGRYGFNVQNGATDGRFVACTSGASASHGWYASGSNNRYSLCKAYYAGYNDGVFSAGHGWYVTAVETYFSAGITWSNCEAQDCAQNGWCFDPSNGPIYAVSVVGCTVDSCNAVGASASPAACGIQTNDLTYSSITANNIFNRPGGAGVMPYGISVNGVQTGVALNGNGVNVANQGIYYEGGYGYVLTEPYQYDVSGLATQKMSQLTLTSYLDVASAGDGIRIAEGSNAKVGTASLSGGTVTVTNTSVTSSSLIFLTDTSGGTKVGALHLDGISAGASFTVKSTNSSDSSSFNYLIIELG